jgi:5'-nucleotidase / UDP-sugar diphosphatase
VDASVLASQVQTVVDFLKAGIVEQFGDVYGTPIGVAHRDIDTLYKPHTPFKDTGIGNLVTDAFREYAEADVAFTANGFISEKIYQGVIVPADILRAVPYGANPETGMGLRLVKVTLSGKQLLAGIEYTLGFAGVSDVFMLQVSGMRFFYNPGNPVGERLIPKSIRIDKKMIDLKANYTVAMNEGMAILLEQLMGIKPLSKTVLPDATEYTILKDYISDLGIVRYKPEGRIREVNELEP